MSGYIFTFKLPESLEPKRVFKKVRNERSLIIIFSFWNKLFFFEGILLLTFSFGRMEEIEES